MVHFLTINSPLRIYTLLRRSNGRNPKMADTKPKTATTMERDFSKVILTLENVLIPDEKLSPTPSMQDGLDLDTETDLRILGCELIQTAGILLKLPQVLYTQSDAS